MRKQGAKGTEPPATADGCPANAMVGQAERGSKRWGRQLFVGFRQSSPVVPGHPILGIFPDKRAVFQKRSEVLERISFDKAGYPLRGLLKCGHHDCAMTPYHSRNRLGEIYHYYNCVRKQNYRKTKCPVGYTNATQIEEYVVEKLKEISKEKDIFEQIVEQVNLNLETATAPYQNELDDVNTRIKGIKKETNNFLDAIGVDGHDKMSQ